LAVGDCYAELTIATEFTLFGEVAASEVKAVKDWIKSQHMQDVFKRVNAISTAPLEFIWLEELAP
jgi:hypothetical protein